ncbi:MAG TPA: glycosyltransferase family A protein [Candidatus Binatia bacterium]|nr:glycosyltransferase family A protein [Candidatus Binatia bacterium]
MPSRVEFALVIPVHNEERYLPTLSESLRRQSCTDVPIVFVNNGSTDGSDALMRESDAARAGRWLCIDEPRVGKFSAMAAGADFCVQQLGARHVGFLDADSYPGEVDWLRTHARILADAHRDLGYIHSPYRYVGLEHLPTFAAAYAACAAVMRSIGETVGWFANSAGAVYASTVVMPFFRSASTATEIGLRCSLFALSEGLRASMNPGQVMTSARRIVASADNLHAWCFYARRFYVNKDINTTAKQTLNPPAPVADLPVEMVGRFFARQAIKFAARNLIPLALFDRSDHFTDRLSAVFDVVPDELIGGALRSFRFRTDLIFTDQFETLLAAIEQTPASAALAQRIDALMWAEYGPATGRP